MSAPRLNDVPRAELEIHTNTTLTFTVEWWADKDETIPVNLAGALGAVKDINDTNGIVLVDLGAATTVVGNKATVTVSSVATALLEPNDRAVWSYVLVSTAGERKPVARGTARIHRVALA